MSDRLAKRVQLTSITFLIAIGTFVCGLAVGYYRSWPFPALQRTKQAAESLWAFGELVPEGKRVRAPLGASRRAFTIHDPERVVPGYYVLLGGDHASDGYAAWLYDDRGRLLHTWRIDYRALDPDGAAPGSDSPHAFHVMDDGSIIVGFDGGNVMARLDSCSVPVWTKDGIFHHAMSRADNGSLWVWRADGTHYAQYHYLTNFDPKTGKTLREIGLVEDVITNLGARSAVFSVRPDHEFVRLTRDPQRRDSVDFFHPNDVDVLGAEHAAMFPAFEAGDLVTSFRSLNLVAVLDPDTRAVKWWRHGPWIAQHDPDFTTDGRISVYSNYPDRGRSEILKIDPATGRVSNELFDGEVEFYSASMGAHQYLPNGNVLIVVPDEGRVLEVTPDGDRVIEFNNLSAAPEFNEHVENGVWVPPDYFRTPPGCSEETSEGRVSQR